MKLLETHMRTYKWISVNKTYFFLLNVNLKRTYYFSLLIIIDLVLGGLVLVMDKQVLGSSDATKMRING